MPKKNPNKTPRSQVKHVLQMLFLRSRERAAAIKRDHYTCQNCGKKQSTAKGREQKVEVHHIAGIEWERLIDLVYEMLLCPPEKLRTLCPEDHEKETLRQAMERVNK